MTVTEKAFDHTLLIPVRGVLPPIDWSTSVLPPREHKWYKSFTIFSVGMFYLTGIILCIISKVIAWDISSQLKNDPEMCERIVNGVNVPEQCSQHDDIRRSIRVLYVGLMTAVFLYSLIVRLWHMFYGTKYNSSALYHSMWCNSLGVIAALVYLVVLSPFGFIDRGLMVNFIVFTSLHLVWQFFACIESCCSVH
jgi:hypothetical protein